MKLVFEGSSLIVTREKGDPPIKGGSWGSKESQLLYHIKLLLNAGDHDLVKKRMWKDGHLVADEQLYLRTRSKNSHKPHVYIWNNRYAIEDAGEEYMREGKVSLEVMYDVFEKGQRTLEEEEEGGRRGRRTHGCRVTR